MNRPTKDDWLHRDAEGRALMVGPSCPDCLRREVARYRCTACEETWSVPGVFKWSWQGKGHSHRPDDEPGWHQTVLDHWNSHGGECVIVPVSNP